MVTPRNSDQSDRAWRRSRVTVRPYDDFAGMGSLDVWYARIEIEDLLGQLRARSRSGWPERPTATVAKARTRDSMTAFTKLTTVVDGELRILSDPPLIERIHDLAVGHNAHELDGAMHALLRAYRQTLQTDRRILLEEFRLVDVARKVVGVGSVGTRAWIALLLGRDEQDPLLLQFKEAQPSVLEEFVGKSEYTNHGERVVTGQHLMQASSDIFLGWVHVDRGIDDQPRDFYGRQLKDWKGSFETEGALPEGAAAYGRVCGWTLARAHARSGDRIAIASYLGNGDAFDRAIAEFRGIRGSE